MSEALAHPPQLSALAARLIVAVPWGPLSGKKAVIAAGSSLSFGRTAFAGFIVPHDRQMSGVHFEIAWDGKRISVRDLGSVTGTFIDGEPGKAEGEIESGGFVKAGETFFTVHVEGATPPRDEETSEDEGLAALDEDDARDPDEEPSIELLSSARERALITLRDAAARGRLFAVLDAARDDRIAELLRESIDASRSLYEGVEGEALADVAPYLVELSTGSALLQKLIVEGWGRRWGVFLSGDLSFDALRRHLRRSVFVVDEETAERLYFRFYDPGVLREYLPTCTAAELLDFMGDIASVFVEGGDYTIERWTAGGRSHA